MSEIQKTEDGMTILPDGSAFFTGSLPLPGNHWLYATSDIGEAPIVLPTGTGNHTRKGWERKLREAARWAVRASTDKGRITDFDPDAMVNNIIIGVIGYWTPDGTNKTSNLHADEPIIDD